MKNKIFILVSVLVLWATNVITVEAAPNYKLPNPLGINTVPELSNRVINGVLGAVGAIALLYLVWGGITWMTSRGNSDSVKKGKDTIVWAILGLAMIFSSYVILKFVIEVMRG